MTSDPPSCSVETEAWDCGDEAQHHADRSEQGNRLWNGCLRFSSGEGAQVVDERGEPSPIEVGKFTQAVGVTLGNNTIRFSVNGEDQGIAFDVPPSVARSPLHPALAVKGCTALINVGETPFKHLRSNAVPFSLAAAPAMPTQL